MVSMVNKHYYVVSKMERCLLMVQMDMILSDAG